MFTLQQAIASFGVQVDPHLDRQAAIPVMGGLQAQGDLLVAPVADLERQVIIRPRVAWHPVPAEGVPVLRGTAGGNTHVLVAPPGAATWTTGVFDSTSLALGAVDVTGEAAYLAHPEHGYLGLGPGRYVIRRQREHQRPVLD